MKTTFLVLLILCAATAVGQTAAASGALSAQVTPLVMSEHPQHASPHALATEQSILGGMSDTYTYAQGERPLWDFGPVSQEVSLGDVARAYRKAKLTGKKAEIYLEKQGS